MFFFYVGLKRVISTPNGLYLRTKFISGTKDRVTFFYLSTCCSTTATITAIDISDNEYSRSIDVTGNFFFITDKFQCIFDIFI